MDDAALVAGVVEGDREAFGAIYDRYGGRIYSFLCSLLSDRDDAADVLHDTFLVAGARLHQLRDPTKLRPWLYAIARHEGLRRIKARSRQESLGDTEVIATGPGPEELATQAGLVELVAAAAEGLSPRDRVVLDLHLRQGLDGQELADAMGVTASHAYVLVSRLRDQVERSLGALLVTRLGRDDCAGLKSVLDGWDGRFSPLMRKRVARHVDGCPTCSDVRSRAVSPLALLAGVPPIALPVQLRQRVLGDVELVSHLGPAWPARRGGFPPPMANARPRRRVLVGAVVAVLLLLGASVMRSTPGLESEPVTSEDDPTEQPGLPAGETTPRPATSTSFDEAPDASPPTTPSLAPKAGEPSTSRPGVGTSVPRATSPPPGPDRSNRSDPSGPTSSDPRPTSSDPPRPATTQAPPRPATTQAPTRPTTTRAPTRPTTTQAPPRPGVVRPPDQDPSLTNPTPTPQ